MTPTSSAEALAIITNNLAEVLNVEILEKVLAEGRSPKIYWGTPEPTSSKDASLSGELAKAGHG